MLTLLALTVLAAEPSSFESLPLFHRTTVIASVSPEMHWFDASYISVEWVGCRIGVPAVPADELQDDAIRVSCWFPSGPTRATPPEDPELRAHYRAALRAARRSDAKTRALGVRYAGTWAEVHAYDFVPVPYSYEGKSMRLYEHGTAMYALRGDELEPAPRPGMFSGGGTGMMPELDGLTGAFVVHTDTPESVDGTSVFLSHLLEPENPVYARAEAQTREAIRGALHAFRSGQPSPPGPPPTTVLPEHTRRTLVWDISAFARPKMEDGLYIVEQISHYEKLRVPLDQALTGVVTWTRAHEDTGLAFEATLDLAKETARIAITGPTGDTAWTEFSVSTELVEDDGRAWLKSATMTATARHPDETQPNGHERRHSLPAVGDFHTLDVYPSGLTQSPIAWTSETADYRHKAHGE
ncbi:MAG: hypothetical protein KC912_02780 [Proteobacteria bacterium]|nr:hypothetical protein [Pseudomonadota bacterium]